MTTKTAQFTPGPWIVETTNTLPGECADNVHRLCYPGYRIHGICAIWNNTRTSKANATLIAAAPAMYEALQQSLVLVELAALEEWGRAVRGEQQPPTTEAKDRLEKVKAALAQAEGKHD